MAGGGLTLLHSLPGAAEQTFVTRAIRTLPPSTMMLRQRALGHMVAKADLIA